MPRVTIFFVDQTELKFRASRINDLVLAAVMRKSARTKQKTLGPSDLGEPCELCLTEKIMLVQKGTSPGSVRQRFSYAAWVGTAIHEKLDTEMGKLDVFTERELTLCIATIPGLGEVWGHCDCFVPEWGDVIDYKTKLDKKAVLDILHQEELFQTDGTVSPRLEKMWDQTMLYGLGAENSGRTVESVSLVVLPRYSDETKEIRTVTRRYDRKRALRVIDRVAAVAERYRIFGVTDIMSHPACYTCNVLRK